MGESSALRTCGWPVLPMVCPSSLGRGLGKARADLERGHPLSEEDLEDENE